jgi:hypothetical protein
MTPSTTSPSDTYLVINSHMQMQLDLEGRVIDANYIDCPNHPSLSKESLPHSAFRAFSSR